MTFLETIDLLTTQTHTFIDTDNGQKLVTRIGLLTELRNAVSMGMEKGGTSTSFGSRPPIDAGAHDLLTEITRQITEALKDATGQPTPFGHAEKYARLWAAAVTEDRMVVVTTKQQHPDHLTSKWYQDKNGRQAVYFDTLHIPAWALAQRWVDQIETFFNPPSAREIDGACPACDAELVYRTKDGEGITSKALSFILDDQGNSIEARCGNCRASWAPDQFERLIVTIGTTEGEIPTITTRNSYCIQCYQDGHTDYINLAGRCACACHSETEAA